MLPHLAQNARVMVLFDGKPLAGAKVEVRSLAGRITDPAKAILTLVSNGEGVVTMPEVPLGDYMIVAFTKDGFEGAAQVVCIGCAAGDGYPAVTDVVIDNLKGV